MRASATRELIAMAHEDPAAIAARAADWDGYYQPVSPAARHTLNTCVHATLLSDRCQLAHDSALADQVDAAAVSWDAARQAAVSQAWAGLAKDPGPAVWALEQTGHGIRLLTARWARLGRLLEVQECWGQADCDEAVRLLSARPTPEGLRGKPTAYLAALYNLRCQLPRQEEAIAAMLEPCRRPTEVLGLETSVFLPEPAGCLQWLRELVAETIEAMGQAEARRAAADAASRTRAMNRALVLHDEKKARLFFRYQGESRSTFHRSYKELIGALKRDAEGPGEGPPDEPGGEAGEPGVSGAVLLAESFAEEGAPSAPVPEPSASMAAAMSPDEPGSTPGSATESHPNEPGKTPDATRKNSPNEPSNTAEEPTGSRGEVRGSDAGPGRPGVAPAADQAAGRVPGARDRGASREVLDRYPELRERLMRGDPTQPQLTVPGG